MAKLNPNTRNAIVNSVMTDKLSVTRDDPVYTTHVLQRMLPSLIAPYWHRRRFLVSWLLVSSKLDVKDHVSDHSLVQRVVSRPWKARRVDEATLQEEGELSLSRLLSSWLSFTLAPPSCWTFSAPMPLHGVVLHGDAVARIVRRRQSCRTEVLTSRASTGRHLSTGPSTQHLHPRPRGCPLCCTPDPWILPSTQHSCSYGLTSVPWHRKTPQSTKPDQLELKRRLQLHKHTFASPHASLQGSAGRLNLSSSMPSGNTKLVGSWPFRRVLQNARTLGAPYVVLR